MLFPDKLMATDELFVFYFNFFLRSIHSSPRQPSTLSLDSPLAHLHFKTPNGEVLHAMSTEFGTLSWGKIKSLPLALRLSMATHHMEWASISSGY